MPYTLMKGLAWVLLAVALGIVIGWLLRSVAAKRQIERAKTGRLDNDDLAEPARLREPGAGPEQAANGQPPSNAELEDARPGSDDAAATGPPAAVVGESSRTGSSSSGLGDTVDEAAAVLGQPIVLDDLTVIVGIGPKIADLCHGIGIRTWANLATTEVSLLRTMLNDAGQRFKAHDPSSWPDQAALLATGQWAEFRAAAERLDGGRPVD
jgi:predicted flap endonuclease-1-like 5' DNA nuclease